MKKEDENKIIGDKIYRLRISRNYDRMTFAELLKVSERTIRRWETGKSKVRESNILKICLLFNISIAYFIKKEKGNDFGLNVYFLRENAWFLD